MSSPAKQVDPRDLFITRNPTGLTDAELEKGRSGFVDYRTHGDYLIFLAGYEAAGGLDPSEEGQGRCALIEAEGCKPEISIQPFTSAAAGTVAHDLNQAEGEQPDLNILHLAAPCAAAAVGRRQNQVEDCIATSQLAKLAAKKLIDSGAENYIGDVFSISLDSGDQSFEVIVTAQRVGAKSPPRTACRSSSRT